MYIYVLHEAYEQISLMALLNDKRKSIESFAPCLRVAFCKQLLGQKKIYIYRYCVYKFGFLYLNPKNIRERKNFHRFIFNIVPPPPPPI